ncbi:MAG: TolC family protein [Thermodesulfobacteriota bacterium]
MRLAFGGGVCAALVALLVAAAESAPPTSATPRRTAEDAGGPRISLAGAIRLALERNPQIRIQASQVAINRGLVQQANGIFDYTISAMLQGTYGKADRQESVTYQAGVSKLLENGITVGPLAEAEQELSGNVAYTQTIVGLSFTIPLLQGLGTDVVTAQQRSAHVDLEAQEHQLRFVTATQLLQVIQAYWALKAAEEQLAIDVQVEGRYRELVSMTEDLVKGAIQPAAQITQARASLEQAVATRIAGEQQLTEAAQSVAVLIGLPNDQVASAPRASQELPTRRSVPSFDRALIQRLVALALERRDDLRAAEKQVESNRILLVAARNELLPTLDLQIAGGLGGLTENEGRNARQLIPGEAEVNGLAAQASITFSFPVENNAAKGELAVQQATVEQSADNRTLLASQISTGVVDAAQGLARAYSELVKLDEAFQLFTQSVSDQRELFKLGMASIVDVTTTEQSLASAQSQRLSAQLNYANAIVQLRYATGTLLPEPGDGAAEALERAALTPDQAIEAHGF